MKEQWYCTSQCSNCQKIFHHMKIVPLDNCTNVVIRLPFQEFDHCSCSPFSDLLIVLSCGEKADVIESGGQLSLPSGEDAKEVNE